MNRSTLFAGLCLLLIALHGANADLATAEAITGQSVWDTVRIEGSIEPLKVLKPVKCSEAVLFNRKEIHSYLV